MNDVLDSLPDEHKKKYSTTEPSKLRYDFNKTKPIVNYFSKHAGKSHQKLVGNMTKSSIYLSRKAKRVSKLLQPRKHVKEIDYVVNVGRKRWNDGLPIELETLALMLVTTSKHMNTNTNL